MKKLKIACIGAGHTHYQGFSEYVQESPYADLAGVWDADPEKAKAWGEAVGARVFASLEEILEDKSVDGVIVSSAPSLHEEYIIAAAKAGKHIVTEIPLAVSVEAARRIQAAVKEAGVHFTLSNPVKHAPQMFAKDLADSGLLGNILNIRARFVHDNSLLYEAGQFPAFGYVYDKSLSGGGAMNNVGMHGAALLYWFLGKPVSAFGMYTSVTEAAKKDGIEENAVIVYKFPNQAIGVIETGWVMPRFQSGAFEVHGTKGSVIVTFDHQVMYNLNDGKGWVTAQQRLMPQGVQHSITYWIENVYFDRADTEYNIDDAVILTEMAYAAYASQGREIIFE